MMYRVLNFYFSAVDLSAVARGQNPKAQKIPLGVSLPNTMVVFERAEGTSNNLAGKSKG
jgi:hypothetical protein